MSANRVGRFRRPAGAGPREGLRAAGKPGAARARVVFFLSDLLMGGDPRRVQALAAGLDRTRYEVCVLSATRGGPLAGAIARSGVPVGDLGVHSKGDLGCVLRLWRYLRRTRPTILHAFNFHAGLLARLVGKGAARVPIVIYSEASTELAKPLARIRIDAWTARWADGVYVNAEAIGRVLARREGIPVNRIWTVPTGIDVAHFAPRPVDESLRARLGLERGDRAVMNVGRLAAYKGQEFLIRAMPEVLRAEPRARLVLIGDGPRHGEFQGLAAALNVSERVVMAGEQQDVAPILAGADLFVLPSTEEGLPHALLEAMAMGVPSVATAVGGVPELLEGCGALVPPADPGALARAILDLLGDRDRALAWARAGRERVCRSYSLHRMVEATDAMYRALLQERALIPDGGGSWAIT